MTTEWYIEGDESKRATLLKQSAQMWQSYLLLRNGDKDTFQSLTDHLRQQYALGTDQFPKSLTKAADVMGAHEVQRDLEKKKKEKNENNNKTENKRKNENNNKKINKETEMKQASVRTKKFFVTCVAKKITWHRNAKRKTKLHTTIGL